MDDRDELEFGGTGCLYALLTWWIPLLLVGALAGGLTLAGLPGHLIVYGGIVLLLVCWVVRRNRQLP